MTAHPVPLSSLLGFAFKIPEPKLTEYLLNPDHPRGKSKAAWFAPYGFSRDDVEAFSTALAKQAWLSTDLTCRPHPHGYGYEIAAKGPLETPMGLFTLPIVTAWNWRVGKQLVQLGDETHNLEFATFVTAYPA